MVDVARQSISRPRSSVVVASVLTRSALRVLPRARGGDGASAADFADRVSSNAENFVNF